MTFIAVIRLIFGTGNRRQLFARPGLAVDSMLVRICGRICTLSFAVFGSLIDQLNWQTDLLGIRANHHNNTLRSRQRSLPGMRADRPRSRVYVWCAGRWRRHHRTVPTQDDRRCQEAPSGGRRYVATFETDACVQEVTGEQSVFCLV